MWGSMKGIGLFRSTCPVRVLALCLLFLGGALVDVQAQSWEQINEDGFGNPNNRYAWAMAAFDDAIYVGTSNLTSPDLLILYFLGIYVPGMTEGAQIWRYHPDTPEEGWMLVAEQGFGNLGNYGVRAMVVYEGALYAGTVNQSSGMELWRTRDGLAWEQVGGNGLGNRQNTSTRAFHEYDGFLYVATENRRGGGELWRSLDGEVWQPVMLGGFGNRANWAVSALETYQGRLYAGTWNTARGFEIWRSEDGWTFEPEVTGGNGNPLNQGIMELRAFGSYLFATTLGIPLGAVLLASNGEQWLQLGKEGFGNPFNGYFWSLRAFDGWLYMGSFKWGGEDGVLRHGFDLYRSRDGIFWDAVSQDGFGDWTNYGVRTLEVLGDSLYLGTAGLHGAGCQVWRMTSMPDDR